MTTRAWGKFRELGSDRDTWIRMDTITQVAPSTETAVRIWIGGDSYSRTVETNDADSLVRVLMRDLSSITQRKRALTDYTGAVK